MDKKTANRKRPERLALRCDAAEKADIQRMIDATGAGTATDAVIAALELATALGLNVPDPAAPHDWTVADAATAERIKNLLS